MIDWLETLWKAAEEGAEVDLPGESDLLSAGSGGIRRAEEHENAIRDEGAEWRADPWQHLHGIPAQPDGMARFGLSVGSVPSSGAAAEQLRRSAAGSALAALYHRVRETVSPGQHGLPGHGGTVVVREEVPAAPGLTEERLDRSLRRDSRRYDGGMSIY